jgi:hypothetical protein
MFKPHISILCWEAVELIDSATKPKEWYLEKDNRSKILDTVVSNNDELRLLYAKICYRPIDHFDQLIKKEMQSIISATEQDLYKDNRIRSRAEFDDTSGREKFLCLIDRFADLMCAEKKAENEEVDYPWAEEDRLIINTVPVEIRKDIDQTLRDIRNKVIEDEEIKYEIGWLNEAVEKAIEKMVGNNKYKKSELDGFLVRLIKVEYSIIEAERKLIEKDEYYSNRPKGADDLYEVYKKARFESSRLDEIKSTIQDTTIEYLSSPWMHNPLLTNSLIVFLIDLQLTALKPTIKENIREAFLIFSFIAGLTALFFWLSRYDFQWSHYQILGWFKVSTMFDVMLGICVGILIMILGYPISLVSGHRKFISYIKKSEPVLAVKRDVLKGSYDGDALSKRLSLVEDYGIYPNSDIYSLLQIRNN